MNGRLQAFVLQDRTDKNGAPDRLSPGRRFHFILKPGPVEKAPQFEAFSAPALPVALPIAAAKLLQEQRNLPLKKRG